MMGNKQYGIYTGAAGTLHITDSDGRAMTLFEVAERLNELAAERDALRDLVRDGFKMSAYAASIHWDGSRNTQEWLDGLEAHIEKFQADAKAALASATPKAAVVEEDPNTCPIHDFPLPCPSCRLVAIEAGVTDFSGECEHGFASSCPMNCN